MDNLARLSRASPGGAYLTSWVSVGGERQLLSDAQMTRTSRLHDDPGALHARTPDMVLISLFGSHSCLGPYQHLGSHHLIGPHRLYGSHLALSSH